MVIFCKCEPLLGVYTHLDTVDHGAWNMKAITHTHRCFVLAGLLSMYEDLNMGILLYEATLGLPSSSNIVWILESQIT